MLHMNNIEFILKFSAALNAERALLLKQESNNDYLILRRQRDISAIEMYWILKSLPDKTTRNYLLFLAGDRSDDSVIANSHFIARKSQFKSLGEFMFLAGSPKLDITDEQKLEIGIKGKALQDQQEYKNRIRFRCKKTDVQKAIKTHYSEINKCKLKSLGGSAFRHEIDLAEGRGLIAIDLDFGGWSQFREEISAGLEGKPILQRQSFCEWLNYKDLAGWQWILQDDLEQSAFDAVEQIMQFRNIVIKCVNIALE